MFSKGLHQGPRSEVAPTWSIFLSSSSSLSSSADVAARVGPPDDSDVASGALDPDLICRKFDHNLKFEGDMFIERKIYRKNKLVHIRFG